MMVVFKDKTKVQHQVEDIADDLIRIMPEGSQLEGFPFLVMTKIRLNLIMIFLMLKQRINYEVFKK